MARENKAKYAVLGILSSQPASGYDIKKMMEKSTNHFWREGDGSIYPILKQLLDEGLVHCELSNIESSKPKKLYSITDDGIIHLQEWLKKDPEIIPGRNELMLKVFFGWNVDADISIQHISQFRNLVSHTLEQYKKVELTKLSKPLSGPNLYQMITLKAGMLYAETSLQWCDYALRILKNE